MEIAEIQPKEKNIVGQQNFHFLLHDIQNVWLIEKGSVELFVIDKTVYKQEGRRHFIHEFSTGSLLFSFSHASHEEIIAIAEPGTIIKTIDLKTFQSALQMQPEIHSEFVSSLDSWLAGIESVFSPRKNTLPTLLQDDSIHSGQWMEALLQYHTVFLQRLSTFLQERSTREKELIEQRSEREEKMLNTSFAALASVLTPEEHIGEAQNDPLLLACQLIGAEVGIQFEEPPTRHISSNSAKRVQEICDASNIRYRTVSLAGRWFKEDGGYLLGFLSPQNMPVALLSSDRGTYTMVDPVTHEKKIVDAKLAKTLAPVAFEFYSSFSNEKISIKQLLKFSFFKQGRKTGWVFLIGLAISLLNLFLPFVSKTIFGTAIPQLDKQLIIQLGGALFVAACSSFVYQLSQGFFIFRIRSLAGNRLELALWDRILKMPMRFFKQYSAGDLYSRVNGFVTIRRAFSNYYILLLLNFCYSIIYLIAMYIFSPILALLSLLIMACSLAIFAFCLRKLTHLQKATYDITGKINGFIVQIISAIAKLRVAGAEKRAFATWARSYADAKKKELKSQYYKTAIDALFALMPILSALVIFSTVIFWIVHSEHNPAQFKTMISTGDFFGFITAFTLFSTAIFSGIPAITYLFRTFKPNWERGSVIFSAEPEVNPKKKQQIILEGGVSVEQVCFRYDKTQPQVLKNISLHALPGEFIGIVGPSGSGKSTLIKLLLGFETPETGKISYDGIDLAHLDVLSVRKQLGVVLQNGSIFAGTIYENLVCGGIYSQQQIERALHLSAFEEDLGNFPMGLHTLLPSGAGTLSGGQLQRLLIARALISNPKILLFDEATSALDNSTQEQLSHNIEKLNVTRIVIAHRLSTLSYSDRIYVIKNGEIIKQCSYDELISHQLEI